VSAVGITHHEKSRKNPLLQELEILATAKKSIGTTIAAALASTQSSLTQISKTLRSPGICDHATADSRRQSNILFARSS